MDPSVASSRRGLWAVKVSLAMLLATAGFQTVIVLLSGSVALLADTVHNAGDALTAIPLGIALMLAGRLPSRRFPSGYGRAEDLAGLAVILIILLAAGIAGYQAVERLLHPGPVGRLGAVVVASLIGFLGNEAAALLRIRVGREIGSAALVADGYHALVDGLTSLAVLVGAGGVWLGYSLADPMVGLAITAVILAVAWRSGRPVFARMLDQVEAEVMDLVAHPPSHVPGVQKVTGVRARWVGHRIHAEVDIAVDPGLTVAQAHDIAKQVHGELLEHLPFLSTATIHVDPANESGEEYHRAPPPDRGGGGIPEGQGGYALVLATLPPSQHEGPLGGQADVCLRPLMIHKLQEDYLPLVGIEACKAGQHGGVGGQGRAVHDVPRQASRGAPWGGPIEPLDQGQALSLRASRASRGHILAHEAEELGVGELPPGGLGAGLRVKENGQPGGDVVGGLQHPGRLASVRDYGGPPDVQAGQPLADVGLGGVEPLGQAIHRLAL